MGNNYEFSLLNWFEMSYCLWVPVACQFVLILFTLPVSALNCWPSSWIEQHFSYSFEKDRWLVNRCQLNRLVNAEAKCPSTDVMSMYFLLFLKSLMDITQHLFQENLVHKTWFLIYIFTDHSLILLWNQLWW